MPTEFSRPTGRESALGLVVLWMLNQEPMHAYRNEKDPDEPTRLWASLRGTTGQAWPFADLLED